MPKRLFQLLAMRAGDQRDRLLAVPAGVVRERGLVVLDEVNDVLAGDVRGGDPNHVRPVEARVPGDAADAAVRDVRAHRAAPQLAGEGEIVEIPRPAGDLVRPVLARRRAAHCAGLELDLLHSLRLTTGVRGREPVVTLRWADAC